MIKYIRNRKEYTKMLQLRNIFLGLLCSAILISHMSCTTYSTESYTKVCDSWKGSDINKLLMNWGIPSDEYTMPNGDKMYTWLWIGGSVITAGYSDWLNMAYANKVTYWCKTTFTVNQAGIIYFWKWEGNNCVAKDED